MRKALLYYNLIHYIVANFINYHKNINAFMNITLNLDLYIASKSVLLDFLISLLLYRNRLNIKIYYKIKTVLNTILNINSKLLFQFIVFNKLMRNINVSKNC